MKAKQTVPLYYFTISLGLLALIILLAVILSLALQRAGRATSREGVTQQSQTMPTKKEGGNTSVEATVYIPSTQAVQTVEIQ